MKTQQTRPCIYFFLLFLILFGSCSKNEPLVQPEKGTLSLQFQNVGGFSKSTDIEDVSAVYISLKNASGEFVYNMEEFALININGGYLTGNIELAEGEYTLVDFVVVNEVDSVVYLAPKEGSEFASLVDYPLPLSFAVSENETSVVAVQVIPADLGAAEKYGYTIFTFEVVDTSSRLNDGLIAYYPFNGNANDSIGNNNGTEYFSQNYVEGVIGLAKDFDGANDYIVLESTLDASRGLSFSFWIYSRGTNGTEAAGLVISKYNRSYDTRSFSVGSYGGLRADSTANNSLYANFYKYGSSPTIKDWVVSRWANKDSIPDNYDPEPFTIVNPMDLPTNEWVHCVINVTETEIQAWINNTLTVKKQREFDTYFDVSYENTYIGNNPAYYLGSNNHLNGYLDELRIYNRGLTEYEIYELYHLRQ